MYTLQPLAWLRSVALRLSLAYSFHFLLKIAFFTAFCLLSQKSDAQIIDSIDLQWEQIHGVPANPTAYAIGAKRIFAVTERYNRPGLYYSDDMGENWHRYPQFFNPTQVLADGDVVLVVNFKEIINNQINYLNEFEGELFRSEDGGLTFTKIASLPNYSLHGIFLNTGKIHKKNENTYFYQILSNNLYPNVSKYVYSSDKGATWHSQEYENTDIFIESAHDTLCLLQYKTENYAAGTGTLTVRVSGENDFSNAQIDTLFRNVTLGAYLETKIFYVNGTFYYTDNGDSIKISYDHNKTFTTVPKIEPITSYKNGYFYGLNDSSIYRIPLQNLMQKEIIHEAVGPNYKYDIDGENFIIKGDTLLRAVQTGTLRSLDGGTNWENRSWGLEVAPRYYHVGEKLAVAETSCASTPFTHWDVVTYEKNFNDRMQPRFVIGDTLFANKWIEYFTTTDKGATWQPFTDFPYPFNWAHGSTMVSSNPNFNQVAFSRDRGKNWAIFPFLGQFAAQFRGLVVEDNWFVFSSTTDGYLENVYSSVDFGQSWTQDSCTSPAIEPYYVTLIKKDHWVFPNKNGQFFISTDFGRTWNNTGNDSLQQLIPNITETRFLAQKDSISVFSTVNNLLLSADLGKHWWIPKNPPFQEEHRIYPSGFLNDTIRYEYTATGFSYAIHQNYLYVSSTTGNFRAPLYPLTGQVPTSEIQLNEKNELQARLFPNPVSETLHIEMQTKTSFKGTISIVNLLGARVFSKKIAFQKGSFMENIDCSALVQGLYFCVFEPENEEVLVRRFVVK